MGGKSSTISTSEPRLGNLRVQTSMYGLAVPMRWGRVRATANLIWFGNFQAVAITTSTSQGGKGGGGVTQVDTKYEYKAAGIMSLGRGPIVGVASAWKDKRRFVGETIAGRTETKTITFTIPPGGVINVPLSGGSFAGNGGAVAYAPPSYENWSLY